MSLPLHRPEEWNGKRFVRTTLRDAGLEIQLGHSNGVCAHPARSSRCVMVADMQGVQAVQVRFCECLDEQDNLLREWRQLFREGWFPATTQRPSTVFTFQMLKTLHEVNLQSKANLYDLWRTIERLTDNTGGRDVPTRYKELSHVMRLWRHLVALKRFGRAHDPEGVDKTQEGSLALECPACPHPHKNIPDGWNDAPPHIRWLYTLFLMMDANFRARCKDRGFDDIQLGPGWSYYVEESGYQAHLKARSGDKQEENTCSAEHNAIIKASIRKEGYIASGVGAVLCARHALVRANGTSDLQLGERQANMDYLFFSAVRAVMLALMVSYDIVCQWYRHLWERMENFPPEMRIDPSRVPTVRFGIPKEHIRVHGPGHSKFSFNYLPRVGRTYGEGIETHWDSMNPLARSAREMSLSMCQELMNDHWGSWNWDKILNFGEQLFRALEEAHAMRVEQDRVFRDYSATFDKDVVKTWEEMVTAWNADHSKPNPYTEPEHGTSSVAAIKHELALEDAAEYTQGSLPAHEVTPGVFLQVGLELEEQQRALRLRRSDGSSLNALTTEQQKRSVLLRRIELWQAIQDVHMPIVSPLRAQASSTTMGSSSSSSTPPSQNHPEKIPLLLPSSLPPALRSSDSLSGLRNKERRLRLAQLSDTLQDIRHLRRILASISDYTRRNVHGEGQRTSGRFRSLYARFDAKVKRATERYRAAHAAMLALDPSGDWAKTYLVLQDADLRGPRREADTGPDADSEGRYKVSWIWLTQTTTTRAPDYASPASAEEFTASMRVEWARAKARAERWAEEEELLVEEMRCILKYCEWKAGWWRSQGSRRVADVSAAVHRGLCAYAEKQAVVWEGLARRCASYWVGYLKRLGPLPAWIVPHEEYARKLRPRDFSKRVVREDDIAEGLSSEESREEDEDENDEAEE